jgi:hypothetical protein
LRALDRRLSCTAMKMMTERFKNRSESGKPPEPVPYKSAAFESTAKAREVACAEGKRRGADEILIASVGSPLVRERWKRDGAGWKRFKARVVGRFTLHFGGGRPSWYSPVRTFEDYPHQVALPACGSLCKGNKAVQKWCERMSVRFLWQVAVCDRREFDIYSFATAALAESFMREVGGERWDPAKTGKKPAGQEA